MKNTFNVSQALLSISLILSLGAPAHAQMVCEDLFGPGSTVESVLKNQNYKKPTLIEAEFAGRMPPLAAKDQLLEEISKIQKKDPELARLINEARREKDRGQSLKVDTSNLPTPMILFLEGTYAKVVGARGLSRPFMTFEAKDPQTLVIHHMGDKFPLMVRWNSNITEVAPVTSIKVGEQIYQLLEIPASMTSAKALSNIPKASIYSLISGSALNKFIASNDSPIMTVASLLHEGRLVFDRPTQVESKEVRKILDENERLRARVRSLLFIAPTASGKTRVLGDAIVNKVLAKQDRKLIVLTTKTPDLTADLAKAIGSQLHSEVGPKNYRLIQWGGKFSEEMSLTQLLKFVEASDVPVVLVTSYPTIAARVSSETAKSSLFQASRGLFIDEAHNATGDTFTGMMRAALEVANNDRRSGNILQGLDIFGVTASPITRTQRTAELFDENFWASVDSPGMWARKVLTAAPGQKASDSALEWLRMSEQYNKARDRGEINAADAKFYKPEERGFKFATIFKRAEKGTSSSVNIERLKEIWPDVATMIEGHGPGVIHTYPRDAEIVASTLSALTGKNFVSLQKMSAEQRGLVYEAFKNQTPYNGKNVDAIVGTIREGLDFPQAGWYLSFKQYVKFPENIQGPGRVVRLALNKLNPVIIFFGHEIDKVSYQDARELVMTRLGRLPGKLPEGRLYSGMRREGLRPEMQKAIENLNLSMEALMRMHYAVAKDLGNRESLVPEKVTEMQSIIRDMRQSGDNREITKALDSFVFELHTYPFFTGQLKSTFALADKLISLEKAGAAGANKRSRLSERELAILNDPAMMELVKEFRSFSASIGPVPRNILSTMDLRLLNVTEVANATNAFVARFNRAPFVVSESPISLPELLRQSMAISPQGIWRNLSAQAKTVMASQFSERSKVSFEESLNDFVVAYKELPKLEVDMIDNNTRDVVDNLSTKLAEELIERLRTGDIEVSALKPEVLGSLDRSDLFAGLGVRTVQNIRNLKSDLQSSDVGGYLQRLVHEGLLTYEGLSRTGDFRILQVIKEMSEKDRGGASTARKLKNAIEEALKELK
ncbi:DEAD/DEAH box helicase [Bdellovibrio sp. HCB2-146]|uniref:DEAD/DEAH box helicase n=1 Tax=Bdellovibrio sp. HCB2-146 TaxID=3394362 RepID=UPI0039BD7EE5